MNTDFDLTVLEEELEKIESIDMEEFGFDLSDEYENFIDKFSDKNKTTDDCYTPQNIYDAVKEYVVKKYNLEGRQVIRAFYPGGDYQNMKYPKGCVVIDNPPFSILSNICDWYTEEEIDFFLFAPYLTNFTSRANHVITDAAVTYENGAVVNTSFLTNLGDVFIESEPVLQQILEEENEKNVGDKKEKITNKYPAELVTSTKVGYLSKYGVEFKLKKEECAFIRKLDEQKEEGTGIYGAGFLISHEATERFIKATEIANKENNRKERIWKLSDVEQAMVDALGAK